MILLFISVSCDQHVCAYIEPELSGVTLVLAWLYISIHKTGFEIMKQSSILSNTIPSYRLLCERIYLLAHRRSLHGNYTGAKIHLTRLARGKKEREFLSMLCTMKPVRHCTTH